jgi:hypothetical protein
MNREQMVKQVQELHSGGRFFEQSWVFVFLGDRFRLYVAVGDSVVSAGAWACACCHEQVEHADVSLPEDIAEMIEEMSIDRLHAVVAQLGFRGKGFATKSLNECREPVPYQDFMP